MDNQRLVPYRRPDGTTIFLPPKKIKAFLLLFRGMSSDQIADELSNKYLPKSIYFMAFHRKTDGDPNQLAIDFSS